MNALRKIIDVKGQSLNIKLPDNFKAGRVEVIILPAEEESTLQKYSTSTTQTNHLSEIKEPSNNISTLRGKLNLSKEQYYDFQNDIKKSRDEWENNI
ncbi:MAG: hypothetical protein ACOCV9_08975 [Marinilabiliaceae bacterium]